MSVVRASSCSAVAALTTDPESYKPPFAGTPEVMTLVYKAVQRGYAVVAMGAHRGGDKWRCYETHWPPEEHHEIPGVSPLIGMARS